MTTSALGSKTAKLPNQPDIEILWTCSFPWHKKLLTKLVQDTVLIAVKAQKASVINWLDFNNNEMINKPGPPDLLMPLPLTKPTKPHSQQATQMPLINA